MGDARNVLHLNLGDDCTPINMMHLVIPELHISALYDLHCIYGVKDSEKD